MEKEKTYCDLWYEEQRKVEKLNNLVEVVNSYLSSYKSLLSLFVEGATKGEKVTNENDCLHHYYKGAKASYELALGMINKLQQLVDPRRE